MDDGAKKIQEHRKRAADIRLHAHRLTDAVCTAAMLSVADNYERLAAALENIAKRAAARI
jgi:hypothetical protein